MNLLDRLIYTPNNVVLEGATDLDTVAFVMYKMDIPQVGKLECKRKEFLLVGRTKDFQVVDRCERPEGIASFPFPPITHRSLFLDDGRVFMNPAYVHDVEYNGMLDLMIPYIGQLLAIEQEMAKSHWTQRMYNSLMGNWYFPGSTGCVPEFNPSKGSQQGSGPSR